MTADSATGNTLLSSVPVAIAFSGAKLKMERNMKRTFLFFVKVGGQKLSSKLAIEDYTSTWMDDVKRTAESLAGISDTCECEVIEIEKNGVYERIVSSTIVSSIGE